MTHAASGATVWLAGCLAAHAVGVGVGVSFGTAAAGAVVCAAGALVPDFDHPRSIASNCFPPVTNLIAWMTRLVSRVVYRATCTEVDDRRGDAGTHRALSHTWPFAVAVAAVASGLLAAFGPAGWWWLGLPLGVGCLVHVAGDACTKSGVPLLWPFRSQGRRWRRVGVRWRLRTGGRVERAVFVAVVVAGFGVAWLLLPVLTAPVPVAHR